MRGIRRSEVAIGKLARDLTQVHANRREVLRISAIANVDDDRSSMRAQEEVMGHGILIKSHGGGATAFHILVVLELGEMLLTRHAGRHFSMLTTNRRGAERHTKHNCRELVCHGDTLDPQVDWKVKHDLA